MTTIDGTSCQLEPSLGVPTLLLFVCCQHYSQITVAGEFFQKSPNWTRRGVNHYLLLCGKAAIKEGSFLSNAMHVRTMY